jgi:hypothetical protein
VDILEGKKTNEALGEQIFEIIENQYKVTKTIGSSSLESEIERLVRLGEEWIKTTKALLISRFMMKNGLSVLSWKVSRTLSFQEQIN